MHLVDITQKSIKITLNHFTFCKPCFSSCRLAEDSRAANTQDYCLCMAKDGGDFIASWGENIKELPFFPPNLSSLKHMMSCINCKTSMLWKFLGFTFLISTWLSGSRYTSKSTQKQPRPCAPTYGFWVINIIQKIIQKSKRKNPVLGEETCSVTGQHIHPFAARNKYINYHRTQTLSFQCFPTQTLWYTEFWKGISLDHSS